MNQSQTSAPQANPSALLPILLFLVVYLGNGIFFEYIRPEEGQMGFYVVSVVLAFSIALIAAFLQNKERTFDEKIHICAKGIGDDNIVTMLFIFLMAGAFSGIASQAGGASSTANLLLNIIPGRFAVPGLFVIACLISMAMGTSVGTISVLAPIACAVSQNGGLSLPFCVGIVVGGAMFGDNLSMISDTTIAATRTQKVDLKDKFRTNFWISLPAAVVTIVLLIIFGRPETAQALEVGGYDIIKVIPYILVLVLALIGMNVFLVLTIGIFAAGIIGMAYGDITFMDFAGQIWAGFQGMIEVFLLSMLCGGIAEMAKHYGGLNWLIDKLSKTFKGKKSAQVGLSVLAALTDMATANNTVAIIVDGPMAREISEKYDIDPRKTASILDMFTCIMQGLIPYGAQFLVVASMCEGRVSPLDIIPKNWYLFLLAGFAILSYFVPWYEKITLKGKWDWKQNKVVND